MIAVMREAHYAAVFPLSRLLPNISRVVSDGTCLTGPYRHRRGLEGRRRLEVPQVPSLSSGSFTVCIGITCAKPCREIQTARGDRSGSGWLVIVVHLHVFPLSRLLPNISRVVSDDTCLTGPYRHRRGLEGRRRLEVP